MLATLPLHTFLSEIGPPPLKTPPWPSKTSSIESSAQTHDDISEQALVLQDATTPLQVVLEADLPAEAYQAALDLSAFQYGSLHYDRQRSKWHSELD